MVQGLFHDLNEISFAICNFETLNDELISIYQFCENIMFIDFIENLEDFDVSISTKLLINVKHCTTSGMVKKSCMHGIQQT